MAFRLLIVAAIFVHSVLSLGVQVGEVPDMRVDTEHEDANRLATQDFKFEYKPFLGKRPIFLNEYQEKLWTASHLKKDLEKDHNCSQFCAANGLVKGVDEMCFCNTDAPDGVWTNILTVRKNMVVPIDKVSCANAEFQADSPEPTGSASSDILGTDSWSFQHFLDGPALKIAQNEEIYRRYNATLLAEIRDHLGISYHNPLVPKMLEKAGFHNRIVYHCAGFNTGQPCVRDIPKPGLSLGCSKPPFVPELARHFRKLMGVHEELPTTGGLLVLAPHVGKEVNNHGRQFTNDKDVEKLVRAKAEEFGLEFHKLEHAIVDSMDSVVEFWGRTQLLVAPHGGAMYNSWFMPAGSGMIEVQADDGSGGSYFWSKTYRLRQYYAPYYTKLVPADGKHNMWHSNMEVNINELGATMDKVWERVKSRSPLP